MGSPFSKSQDKQTSDLIAAVKTGAIRYIEDALAKSQQNASERLTSALVTAIKTGSIERIEAALADGADINAADRDLQRTPLQHATYTLDNATEVIRALLSRGANPNVRDSYGHSPLQNATTCGELAAIKVLIEHNACLDATNHQGFTALHRAAMFHPDIRPDVARSLIRSGASVNTLNTHGDTPLHIAIRLGNTPLVEALINNGADVNAREDDSGPTPLRNLCQCPRDPVYKLLVAEGGHV